MNRMSLGILAAVLWLAAPALAQFGGGGMGGGMGGGYGGGGGVYIDPQGVIRALTEAPAGRPRPSMPRIDADLAARSDLRQISLRRLDAELRELGRAGLAVPAEMALLAGLTKVEYILIDREQDDVLIAGPAEGWEYGPDGREVGRTTRRPVLHLEDLVVALRCVLGGPGEASCSMDPQRAGLEGLQRFLGQNRLDINDPRGSERFAEGIAKAYGLQTIQTGGVPEGSRFALVMIEADYRMKRIAVGLEKVAGVTSHLDVLSDLAAQGAQGERMARWWFTPDYDAIRTNEAGTLFQLVGRGVKLQNEEVLIDRQGGRQGTGKASADWDRFSDSFSQRFPELEAKDPVFADLHNLFDLMMVAGLVRFQGRSSWLADSTLLDPAAHAVPTRRQPKLAEPVVNVIVNRQGRKYLANWAYGGVSVRPASVVREDRLVIDPKNRQRLARPDSWWADIR